MSEHTFTPGPWCVPDWKQFGRIDVRDTDDQVVAAVYLRGATEEKANARLIAASPDLYAACEELLSLVDSDHVEPVELARCRFDGIRAALAKARGEAKP